MYRAKLRLLAGPITALCVNAGKCIQKYLYKQFQTNTQFRKAFFLFPEINGFRMVAATEMENLVQILWYILLYPPSTLSRTSTRYSIAPRSFSFAPLLLKEMQSRWVLRGFRLRLRWHKRAVKWWSLGRRRLRKDIHFGYCHLVESE